MKKNIFKKLLYTSLLLVMIFITIVGCEKTEPVTETPIITDTPVVPTPTPIVEYTVTFNSNGGSMISNLKVELNGLITKPTDPTKEGHKFLGWYIDESFTTAWDFEKNPVIVKPVNLGSSIGITKANDKDELLSALDTAFGFADVILVERAITELKEIASFYIYWNSSCLSFSLY